MTLQQLSWLQPGVRPQFRPPLLLEQFSPVLQRAWQPLIQQQYEPPQQLCVQLPLTLQFLPVRQLHVQLLLPKLSWLLQRQYEPSVPLLLADAV